MNKKIVKYTQEGIIINGDPKNGYRVFTNNTQWFTISSLDELTPKTFEVAIERQKKLDDLAKNQFETFNHFQEL